MVSLSVDYTNYYRVTNGLYSLQSNLNSLQAKYAKAVVEIVLVRVFDLLTETFASVAAKLVSGAIYVDGTHPVVLMPSRSTAGAFNSMINHGRRRPKYFLFWSNVRDIKDNVQYVIDPTDHFVQTLDNHSLLISEMRYVRNRIAHNNERSRRNYRNIVLKYYGAYLNSVSPGTLLVTHRQSPSLIQQYILQSRILIKQLVRA